MPGTRGGAGFEKSLVRMSQTNGSYRAEIPVVAGARAFGGLGRRIFLSTWSSRREEGRRIKPR